MRAVCKDALVCDFAEYYHIYDLDSVKVRLAATLACGLPAESRTIRQLSGQKHSLDTMLLAGILDAFQTMTYLYRKKNFKGKHKKPESVVQRLAGHGKDTENDIRSFRTKDDFERERQRLLTR